MAKIVIWLGAAPEVWDPATALLRGIGGSETAAIYVSDELARLGHDVEVYADVPQVRQFGLEEHGEHPVTFYPYMRWSPKHQCDLFVSSRQPGARRECFPFCGRAWLWMHDLHCGPDWDNVLGTDYDRILCLSKWAREQFLGYYPAVSPDKVVQTRNGLDLSLFKRLEAAGLRPGAQHLLVKPAAGYGFCRMPLRATYSSSPDRGLARLLDFWPKIFAKYGPDSSLHVYYGFETWRRLAELHDQRDQLAQAELLEHRLASTPGVIFHGRAGQEEVARSYLQSQLWLYPTDFQETSCCHPDTMISLPGDHRLAQPYRVKISELVGRTNFPVYTYDVEEDRFRIGTALWCAKTREASELVELTLDDGSMLRVTHDHKVMNFESEWVEAGKLEPGDRLLALHHRYAVMIKDVSGRWVGESRLVGEWIAGCDGKCLSNKQHVDHLDPLRLDNNPERLQILAWASHFKKTHLGTVRRQHNSEARIRASKDWVNANLEEVTARLKKNGKKLWNTVNALSPGDRKVWCAMRAYRKVVTMRLARLFPDYKERVRRLAARHSTSGQIGRGFWDWLNSLPSEIRRGIIEDTCEGRWNHRIVAVRRIPGGPVYDMEVAKYHNFVADGVVVHNCITAMEAQAAGCHVVATRCGALPETASQAWFVDGPTRAAGSRAPDYEARFLAAVDQAMASDYVYIPRIKSWAEVAAQWDRWITSSEVRS